MKPVAAVIARGRRRGGLVAALVLFWAAAAYADPPSAPLCGINSLYTALRSQGIRTEYAALLRPRYVSSGAGSTIEELRLAAREQGAYCEVLTNLSISDLRHLPCPAILHVKGEYDAPQYDHYVLCAPIAGVGVALYNPPDPLVRGDGNELIPVWDGTAVLVSSEPINMWPIWQSGVLRVLSGAGLILLLAVGAALARRDWPAARRLRLGPLKEAMVILLLGASIGGAYHLLAAQGFAAQRAATAAIADAHFAEPPEVVDLAGALSLLADGARFIDARTVSDFAQGHIPGAINVPPIASRFDRTVSLSDVAKDQRLVVYCQSPACASARLLARRLSRDGFSRISVFAGGWSRWSESVRSDGSSLASDAHTQEPNQ